MGGKEDKKEKKEKHKDKEKKEKKEGKLMGDEIVKSELGKDANLDQRSLFKIGQKFLTPPAADATRAFYESLYKENPDSKIAIKFCVENGLFAVDQHKKMYKRFMHLKDKGAYDTRAIKTTARILFLCHFQK